MLHDVLRKDCDVAGGREGASASTKLEYFMFLSLISVMLNKLDDRVEEEPGSKTKNQLWNENSSSSSRSDFLTPPSLILSEKNCIERIVKFDIYIEFDFDKDSWKS